MQVILLEKVVNLGQLGDVVRVKDGFARNYLIPHGMARRATESAVKEFEGRRAELEKVQADKLVAAQALGDKMNGTTVQISGLAATDSGQILDATGRVVRVLAAGTATTDVARLAPGVYVVRQGARTARLVIE